MRGQQERSFGPEVLSESIGYTLRDGRDVCSDCVSDFEGKMAVVGTFRPENQSVTVTCDLCGRRIGRRSNG